MTTFTVNYVDDLGNPRVSNLITLQDSTDPSLPVVILLHGTAGVSADMANPAAHPGRNHDYLVPIPPINDLGWHPGPNFGIAGLELDPLKAVPSWQSALTAEGFGFVNYDQVDSTGLLANPVRELAAVVTEVIGRLPVDRKIAVLAHSRGGLLARKYLVDNASDAVMRDRLSTLVTLHAPHGGTELANIASTINAVINGVVAFDPALDPLLQWVRGQVNEPAFAELAVGSQFLVALGAAEAVFGAPFVPVHTFGGTSTLLSRARAQLFTFTSAIPQLTSLFPPRVQFHWRTVPEALPSPASGIPELAALAAELENTVGDLLVTDARAQLPGAASHQSNPINHAEALWDVALQQQAIAAIRSEI